MSDPKNVTKVNPPEVEEPINDDEFTAVDDTPAEEPREPFMLTIYFDTGLEIDAEVTIYDPALHPDTHKILGANLAQETLAATSEHLHFIDWSRVVATSIRAMGGKARRR